MEKLGVPGAIVLAGALVAAAVYFRPNWGVTADGDGYVLVTTADPAGTHMAICRVTPTKGGRQCATTLDGLSGVPGQP